MQHPNMFLQHPDEITETLETYSLQLVFSARNVTLMLG
jgi:hypothetical protein